MESRSPLIRSGVNLYWGSWVIVRMMETNVTYRFGHDSQVPQVLAVAVFEKVMETVCTAVGAGVPGGGVPDAPEKRVRERLVEDNKGIARLPEGVEEGNLPGSDGVGGGGGGHEAN